MFCQVIDFYKKYCSQHVKGDQAATCWINKSRNYLKEHCRLSCAIQILWILALLPPPLGSSYWLLDSAGYPLRTHTHTRTLVTQHRYQSWPSISHMCIIRFLLLRTEAVRNLSILHIAGDPLIWQSSYSSHVPYGKKIRPAGLVFKMSSYPKLNSFEE